VDVPGWVWLLTCGGALTFLAVDVLVIGRRPHEPSLGEAGRHLAFFVGLAIAFGIGLWVVAGSQSGAEFFAGWLTEYSLSIDNLFVFIVLMQRLDVPRAYQQTALLIGIILALIFRGLFIAVGAAAIDRFSWIFYLFGVFLIYTAVKLARAGEMDEGDVGEGKVVGWLRDRLPISSDYDGVKITTRSQGRRLLTPMFVVLVALGVTDVLFALDSIPAIFGLTKEPYLVLMANVFALMGLRQLYFLIGGLLQRLVYLGLGLAFLLFFIGVKLILHALHSNALPFINGGQPLAVPEVSITVSLLVIVGTLAITTGASVLRGRIAAK
jgi:tellurite resistance protein TerC